MIHFATNVFRRSHGRAPSRTACGSWAFEIPGSKEPWFAPGMLTLSEAKRAAREEAKRRGYPDALIEVAP